MCWQAKLKSKSYNITENRYFKFENIKCGNTIITTIDNYIVWVCNNS